MREKITYMTSPMSFFTRWPIANRVMSTVIDDIGKWSVDFFDAALHCYVKSVYAFRKMDKKFDSAHACFSYNHFGATSNFSRFPHFYVAAGMCDDFILESIKTDTVFYSAPFAQDFRIIQLLLENGKRVFLGGTATMIYDDIRENLTRLGATEEHQKNLCIVNGYVDRSTPLWDYYKKWEDVTITENDFLSMWDCMTDWTLENRKIYEGLFNTNLGLVLDTDCWWGKCKYCTFYCVPVVDFTKGLSAKELTKKIVALGDLYRSRNIYFFDAYLKDTKKFRETIFSLVEDHGFKNGTYTGMHVFHKKYLDFLNRGKIDPFIGLEHTNSKTLKYIDKGFDFETLHQMFDNMYRYLNDDIRPVMCIMGDLPIIADSRGEAITDILSNYEYIYNQRERFIKAGKANGIGFQVDLKGLRHLPLNTIVTKDGLIREASPEEFNLKDVIGLWTAYLYMSEAQGIPLDKFDLYTNKPLVRFLPNGEKLESDLYFMGKELVNDFSTWR